MIKAVVKGGMLVPRDPLPADWQDGTEVQVERTLAKMAGNHPTDTWMDEVEAVAAKGDPVDDLRLEAAIQDVRQREKDLARQKLGLAS